MPSRPFNVIYAFALTETFAAYILIRGILYPFIVQWIVHRPGNCGRCAPGAHCLGHDLLRSTFLPWSLRLAPAHDSDYPLCPVGHRKHPRHECERLRPEHWPVHHDCGCYWCGGCFIFVLMPSSRRYIEAVTEASGEEARSTAADAAKP